MNNKKNKLIAFSLIEVLVVIAIVGLIAAIALPAYQNYIVRTKVFSAIVYADAQIETAKVDLNNNQEISVQLGDVSADPQDYLAPYVAQTLTTTSLTCPVTINQSMYISGFDGEGATTGISIYFVRTFYERDGTLVLGACWYYASDAQTGIMPQNSVYSSINVPNCYNLVYEGSAYTASTQTMNDYISQTCN